ncbi:fucose-1-phosphate guanylyltransferase [Engraulis encrasicolus]|uniref:fucose-1-phosphate guanylyltransferase n=1 Tax=Engraulis encrasicolus TaxID=184585 RepID=UPI002FD55386
MTEVQNEALQRATGDKLKKFNKIRGKEVQPGQFWDLVVLTAVDEDQKFAYELQIKEKLGRKELPFGLPYHVFADPPGSKIGNGGSTLYALQHLEEMYGKALSAFRVILIHAGGFSQRLPSASALGKIFTAVPCGEPLYQMLELKLAMYVDFPVHMKPGVLVTCADDIELYSIPEGDSIRFDSSGFTALAHPSSLSIGTTHGVFVLESSTKLGDSEMEYTTCQQFLHKPSVEKMQGAGAVCRRPESSKAALEEEFVYTDSTYYMDHATSVTLLNMLKEVQPLTCEIDAYGDFLQALGPGASVEYTSNTSNVTKEESGLVSIRQKIFNRLKGTPLNVILLNNSKFYHIGTTEEYLFHLTQDAFLSRELGLLPNAFSVCDLKAQEPPVACVMHSVLHASTVVSPGSVVEYSRLCAGVTVGEGSIVSGCWVDAWLSVPSQTFLHCLSVTRNGRTKFVTVAFGIKDDLKRSVASPADASALRYFAHGLAECAERWGLPPEGGLRFSGDQAACSLWNARLFPLCPDPRSSVTATLQMVGALREGSAVTPPLKDPRRLSLQEALLNKNLADMLRFRKGLFEDILKEK